MSEDGGLVSMTTRSDPRPPDWSQGAGREDRWSSGLFSIHLIHNLFQSFDESGNVGEGRGLSLRDNVTTALLWVSRMRRGTVLMEGRTFPMTVSERVCRIFNAVRFSLE